MKRTAYRRLVVFSGVILVSYLVIASGGVAFAQKPEIIKLKYATAYNNAENPSLIASYWCDLVEKKTGGRVKIERYFSGAAGGPFEMLSLCKSGTIDLVTIIPVFFPEQMPLHAWQNDNIWRKPEETRPGANALEFEIPETAAIFEKEAAKNGVKFIMWNSASGYGIIFRGKATKLADIKGKKLRATGLLGLGMAELGGVPANVALSEAYDAISRGVIDGTTGALAMHIVLKLYEVSKSYIDMGRDRGSAPLILSLTKWKSLPSSVQEAMVSATKEALVYDKELDIGFRRKGFKTMLDEGLAVTRFEELPAEEQKRMDAIWDRIYGVDWLSRMEKKGLGEEAKVIYGHYQKLLKQYRR